VGVLRASAADSFQAELAKGKAAKDVLKVYLEDTIAAEKSFETQLLGFSKEAGNSTDQQLFQQHAQETKEQYLQLSSRLEQLGGSASTLKGMLAHAFNFAPKIAQLGHDEYERQTQNLMMAFAVENAEVAIYESLAEVCRIAGDAETEALALSIQEQERATADKVWKQIAPAVRCAMATSRMNAMA
jgi:ferritin-like metal-binding protein YciE